MVTASAEAYIEVEDVQGLAHGGVAMHTGSHSLRICDLRETGTSVGRGTSQADGQGSGSPWT